jgi:hypothetical protein
MYDKRDKDTPQWRIVTVSLSKQSFERPASGCQRFIMTMGNFMGNRGTLQLTYITFGLYDYAIVIFKTGV